MLHHANSTKLHRRLFISALTVDFVHERLQFQPVDAGLGLFNGVELRYSGVTGYWPSDELQCYSWEWKRSPA